MGLTSREYGQRDSYTPPPVNSEEAAFGAIGEHDLGDHAISKQDQDESTEEFGQKFPHNHVGDSCILNHTRRHLLLTLLPPLCRRSKLREVSVY